MKGHVLAIPKAGNNNYWASSNSTGITNVVWQRAGNTTERLLFLTVVQHRAVLCPPLSSMYL